MRRLALMLTPYGEQGFTLLRCAHRSGPSACTTSSSCLDKALHLLFRAAAPLASDIQSGLNQIQQLNRVFGFSESQSLNLPKRNRQPASWKRGWAQCC
ncbi:unnamed protein product [Boreogadus saida]